MSQNNTKYDRSRLNDIPTRPGIYIMRNSSGEIIYVGKAINLRNRVRSYFQDSKNLSVKTNALVSHIANIETIVVENELEALILECNLIKKNKPKYNISLRDGKTYPYIAVTLSEEYPRVIMTREKHKDGNLYFGPYTSVYAVKKTIDAINRAFPLKMCRKETQEGKRVCRPCLNYHLGLCLAPCTGEVDKESYRERVDSIIKILDGKTDELVHQVELKMQEASKNLDFEVAATLRDQIASINHISEKQRIIKQNGHDQDIIAVYKDRDLACLQILNVRAGQLVGRDHTYVTGVFDDSEEDIITAITKQYYTNGAFIPKEIIFAQEFDEGEQQEIISLLSNEKGSQVHLTFPKRGDKVRLANLAKENAKIGLEQYESLKMRQAEAEESKSTALKDFLQISTPINRIEAYDISNISGTNNVGGMVVFTNSKPDKKAYRRFKIKSVDGQDDYSSMKEMIFRRIERGNKELEEGKKGSSFLPFPEVFAIDGGATHVKAVESVLELYPDLDIKVIGLVKDEHHRIRGIIYNDKEYPLEYAKPLSKFLSDISEEVHRFAINYHRTLRKKSMFESQLEEIPGIGKKRRADLIRHFGSLKNIKEATLDELEQIPSMNKNSAQAVFNHFSR